MKLYGELWWRRAKHVKKHNSWFDYKQLLAYLRFQQFLTLGGQLSLRTHFSLQKQKIRQLSHLNSTFIRLNLQLQGSSIYKDVAKIFLSVAKLGKLNNIKFILNNIISLQYK